jgi:hypothetical protein
MIATTAGLLSTLPAILPRHGARRSTMPHRLLAQVPGLALEDGKLERAILTSAITTRPWPSSTRWPSKSTAKTTTRNCA